MRHRAAMRYRVLLILLLGLLLGATSGWGQPAVGAGQAPDPSGAPARPTIPPHPTGTPTPTRTAVPTQTVAPTDTPVATRTPAPTHSVADRPDACEENDTVETACVIPLDAVSGPYTIVPEDDADVYSLDLGATATGLATTLAVRGTDGLDLLTTVYRVGSRERLAVIESPVISTTLPVDLTGWILIRVENRAAGLSIGQSYRIEARRTLPESNDGTDDRSTRSHLVLPDALENNWSPAHAAPIGVGQIYDLTFACPVPHGCPGGDHDYLRVAVKQHVTYLIATFDLGPGVDTVLDLYWGDEETPIRTNDDAYPGYGFASSLLWTAPADGEALIRIGPRTGGLDPWVEAADAGRYRVAVALATSVLAQQMMEQSIAAANLPTATPIPPTPVPPSPATAQPAPTHPAPAPAQPAPAHPTVVAAVPTAITDALQGPALVITDTVLRLDPTESADAITDLPTHIEIMLLGQAHGLWVRAQVDTSAIPGWVHVTLVRPLTGSPLPQSPAAGTSTVPGVFTTPVSGPQQPTIAPLPPDPGRIPTPIQRVPVRVSVLVVDGPTGQPVAGMRVQLATVFGDVLVEAVTPADGSPLVLTRDVLPGTALVVRVPAVGIQHTLDLATTDLRITLPGRVTSASEESA